MHTAGFVLNSLEEELRAVADTQQIRCVCVDVKTKSWSKDSHLCIFFYFEIYLLNFMCVSVACMYFCVLPVCTSFRGQKGVLDFPGTDVADGARTQTQVFWKNSQCFRPPSRSVPHSHFLKTLNTHFSCLSGTVVLTSPKPGYVFIVVVFWHGVLSEMSPIFLGI